MAMPDDDDIILKLDTCQLYLASKEDTTLDATGEAEGDGSVLKGHCGQQVLLESNISVLIYLQGMIEKM